MKIVLKGSDVPGLDGEYELDPEPNTREITRFRKELGISPSEMTEIISVGSVEVVPFYIYTAMHRQGRALEATALLDMGIKTFGEDNITVHRDPETDRGETPADTEEDKQLPPK